MFQKLANSEGVGLQIEKVLDDFTWNDPGGGGRGRENGLSMM